MVFHCHAGCAPEAIVSALSLEWGDLTAPREEPVGGGESYYGRPIVAAYDYRDVDGKLLFQVLRLEGKDFRQRRPDGGGGWINRVGDDVPRVLYRLPELVAAGADEIWVAEGEKDVLALVAAGVQATCCPGGAGKWGKVREDCLDAFLGASVVVVADKDEPGRRHAEQVRDSLASIASAVRIVEAAEGKDAADHLTAGHPLEQFVQVWPDPLPEYEAMLESALLDSEGLDALEPPTPLIEKVLFLDSLAWLIGEPANGKSFVALDWAGHVGTGQPWCGFPVRQGTVIYVSPESPGGVRMRKQAWEAAMGRRMDNVLFLPLAVQAKTAGHWQSFVRVAKRREAVLIILDTQARMTVGMEENSALDMGEFVDALERLRAETNACVLVVHHKTRGAKNMRGSTALEGAASTIINSEKDGPTIILSADPKDGGKTKDLEPFDPIKLRLVPSAGSVILAEVGAFEDHSAIAVTSAVRMKLAEWWGQRGSDWLPASKIESLGYLPERTFYRVKNDLVRAALLEEEQRGRGKVYRLLRDPG